MLQRDDTPYDEVFVEGMEVRVFDFENLIVRVSEYTQDRVTGGGRVTAFFVAVENNTSQRFTFDPAAFSLSYSPKKDEIEVLSPLDESALGKKLEGNFWQRWALNMADSTSAPSQSSISSSTITGEYGNTIGTVQTQTQTSSNRGTVRRQFEQWVDERVSQRLKKHTLFPEDRIAGTIYFERVKDQYAKRLTYNTYPIYINTQLPALKRK